jgi:hypothetical protein
VEVQVLTMSTTSHKTASATTSTTTRTRIILGCAAVLCQYYYEDANHISNSSPNRVFCWRGPGGSEEEAVYMYAGPHGCEFVLNMTTVADFWTLQC